MQGSRPGCDEASSHALLDRFILELGGNFIDTSDVYQFGVSESIIGRWMEKHPSLRSKVGFRNIETLIHVPTRIYTDHSGYKGVGAYGQERCECTRAFPPSHHNRGRAELESTAH